MKLITKQGKAEIGESSLIYKPNVVKNDLGQDEYQFAIIGSDLEFENGEIQFTIKIKEPNALAQIVFNSETGVPLIVCGLNAMGAQYGALQLIGNKWEILRATGEFGMLELNKEYQIKIVTNGSLIDMYVDGVRVIAAYGRIKKSQLQFYLRSSSEIEITNITDKEQKPKAFVIMQFTPEYNQLYAEVIKPVTEEYGINCERSDEKSTTNPILQDIVESIEEASLIIAEITPDNPNVYYEVGYAHALKKPTILLSNRTRAQLPFDVSGFRTLFYDNTIAGKRQVEERLRKFLTKIFN